MDEQELGARFDEISARSCSSIRPPDHMDAAAVSDGGERPVGGEPAVHGLVQHGVQVRPKCGDPGPHFGDVGVCPRRVDVDAADDDVFNIEDGVGEVDALFEVVGMPSQVAEVLVE